MLTKEKWCDGGSWTRIKELDAVTQPTHLPQGTCNSLQMQNGPNKRRWGGILDPRTWAQPLGLPSRWEDVALLSMIQSAPQGEEKIETLIWVIFPSTLPVSAV